MREKLIELVAEKDMECNYMDCCKCEYFKTKRCKASMIADHLIANGVTFAEDNNVLSKWTPVTERLPENIGLFLVIEKHWIDGSPCRRIAKWNTQDWFTADRKSKEITPRVTHWMPLPKPPKGSE